MLKLRQNERAATEAVASRAVLADMYENRAISVPVTGYRERDYEGTWLKVLVFTAEARRRGGISPLEFRLRFWMPCPRRVIPSAARDLGMPWEPPRLRRRPGQPQLSRDRPHRLNAKRDVLLEINAQLLRALGDVVTVYAAGKRFVLHLLAHGFRLHFSQRLAWL